MSNMYIPRYFSIDEMTRSTVGAANGIRNQPGVQETRNLYALIENILDPVRERWGKPITVSSGYRCAKLNTLVKGAKCSSHMTGQAADITVGGKENNWKLYELIRTSGLPFTKLIYEHNKNNIYWVHVSFIKGQPLRKCYIYHPETKVYELDAR